jgi:hypothetical protein
VDNGSDLDRWHGGSRQHAQDALPGREQRGGGMGVRSNEWWVVSTVRRVARLWRDPAMVGMGSAQRHTS